MKKIFTILAAAVAAFCLASCSKEQTPDAQPSVQKTYPTVEISVDNIGGTIDDGVTTKAAKSAWLSGDKINIWFDEPVQKYGGSFSSRDVHFSPELVLTFNGSSWEPEFSDFFDASKLKENGKAIAIYENSNNLTGTFYFRFEEPGSSMIYNRYHPAAAATNHYMTPMIVSANEAYHYDSEEDKIVADLSAWEFLTKVQVLVTGLKQHPSYYILDLRNEDGADGNFYRLLGFTLSSTGIVYPYDYNTYAFGTAGGTLTEEGMAFYFYDAVSPGESKTYKFRIGMLMPPNAWTYGEAKFENKTINTSSSKITCIKIDKSKFGNSSLK